MQLFGPNIGAHHLEVAVGSGTLLDLILKWRKRRGFPEAQIKGIDYAESMLAGAINRFKGNSRIELYHADVISLLFRMRYLIQQILRTRYIHFPIPREGYPKSFVSSNPEVHW